jgi:hypothetical protein
MCAKHQVICEREPDFDCIEIDKGSLVLTGRGRPRGEVEQRQQITQVRLA